MLALDKKGPESSTQQAPAPAHAEQTPGAKIVCAAERFHLSVPNMINLGPAGADGQTKDVGSSESLPLIEAESRVERS
jgi:hypothetical protein